MFDLLYAAAVGDLPTVKHCIQRSQKATFLWGDLTRTCGRGRAALHYAVLGGHKTAVLELIRAGAQLNWQDSDGITCLMVAAERGNEDLLQLFLHHKADVHLNARDGSTAAHHAAKRGQIECLQHLLKAGSCIVATDALGRMLIHWAAEVGHVAMAKMLLEQGCPVSGGTKHVMGETPLHVAVKHGQADIVKLLLLTRAAVNAVTKEGQTPLHICCTATLAPAYSMQRIAGLLLSHKNVDIHATDLRGKSAQFYTKDVALKNMIHSALQGKLPEVPDSMEGLQPELQVDQSMAAVAPVTVSPHPLIPGHRWVESEQCGPDAGPSSRAVQKIPDRSIHVSARCPFAQDLGASGDIGLRAAQLRQEELIWKASQVDRCNGMYGCRDTGLIPSDRMWFDSGSHHVLSSFPARQYLGRYRS